MKEKWDRVQRRKQACGWSPSLFPSFSLSLLRGCSLLRLLRRCFSLSRSLARSLPLLVWPIRFRVPLSVVRPALTLTLESGGLLAAVLLSLQSRCHETCN